VLAHDRQLAGLQVNPIYRYLIHHYHLVPSREVVAATRRGEGATPLDPPIQPCCEGLAIVPAEADIENWSSILKRSDNIYLLRIAVITDLVEVNIPVPRGDEKSVWRFGRKDNGRNGVIWRPSNLELCCWKLRQLSVLSRFRSSIHFLNPNGIPAVILQCFCPVRLVNSSELPGKQKNREILPQPTAKVFAAV
jgi:hypothetical protein